MLGQQGCEKGTGLSTAEDTQHKRILDAAERRFLVDGFERCSVDSIAADARVSKREIYRAWPGKADLFAAVANRTFESIQIIPREQVNTADTEAILQQHAGHLLDIFCSERSRGFFRATAAATRHFPDLMADIHHRRTHALIAIHALFDSLFPDSGDPSETAIRFGSMATEGSRYLLDPSAPSMLAREQYRRIVAHLFLHGWERANTVLDRQAIAPDLRIDATLDLETGYAPQPTMRMPVERFALLKQALLQEFLTSGYPRANLGKAASLVGVSNATIYRQFGNKEGTFEYLVAEAIHALHTCELTRTTEEATDLPSAVTALMGALLDYNLQLGTLDLQRLLVEEATIFPHLARAFYAIQLANTKAALTALCDKWDAPHPNDIVIRIFHVLASFGSRVLFMSGTEYHATFRAALNGEIATIFWKGLRPAR